jgi:hypothetical protein
MIRDRVAAHLRRWIARLQDASTERRELCGLEISILPASRDEPEELWRKLEDALRLIATHAPVWIARMRRLGVRIHVQRTPGTRAKLVAGQVSVLDSYFVANFFPAQVASSIVHEAVHARVHAREVPHRQETMSREERICRRAELRFGRTLLAHQVEGAEAVIQRAEESLSLADDEVAPAVDWRELDALERATRLEESALPGWYRRWAARRLDSAGGTAGERTPGE